MHASRYDKTLQRQALKLETTRYGSGSPITHIRKAVFAPITIVVGGKRKNKTLLTAYIEKINESAARGSVGAMRELTWLTMHLMQKQLLHHNARESQKVSPTLERIALEMTLHDQLRTECARICIMIMPDVRRAYREANPDVAEIDVIVPFELQEEFDRLKPKTEIAMDRVAIALRRRAARRTQGELEVGYCKPPVATRWQPGVSGNPSGKAKSISSLADTHRKAMMKIIGVKIEGRRAKFTQVAIAVRQLFVEAMNGTKGAYLQVRKILVMLDELKLLSPPPPERRRSRRRNAEMTHDIYKSLLPFTKARLLAQYETVYGKIPPFETWLERMVSGKAATPLPRPRIRTRLPSPRPIDNAATNELPEPYVKPRTRTRQYV